MSGHNAVSRWSKPDRNAPPKQDCYTTGLASLTPKQRAAIDAAITAVLAERSSRACGGSLAHLTREPVTGREAF